MISNEQLKLDIDQVDDATLSIVSKPLISSKSITNFESSLPANHSFKNSVIYEGDIVSPIAEIWNAEL
jgi:hypothetical protein